MKSTLTARALALSPHSLSTCGNWATTPTGAVYRWSPTLDRWSRFSRERMDCTPFALSVACSIPYLEAKRQLAQRGRKRNGRLPRGAGERGWNSSLLATVREAGFLTLLQDGRRLGEPKTVRSLEPILTSGDVLLVFTRGHAFACRDGRVWDWTAGRLHRILSVWRVCEVSS